MRPAAASRALSSNRSGWAGPDHGQDRRPRQRPPGQPLAPRPGPTALTFSRAPCRAAATKERALIEGRWVPAVPATCRLPSPGRSPARRSRVIEHGVARGRLGRAARPPQRSSARRLAGGRRCSPGGSSTRAGAAGRGRRPGHPHGLPPIGQRCAGGDVSALTASSEAAPAKPWTKPRPPSSSPRRRRRRYGRRLDTVIAGLLFMGRRRNRDERPAAGSHVADTPDGHGWPPARRSPSRLVVELGEVGGEGLVVEPSALEPSVEAERRASTRTAARRPNRHIPRAIPRTDACCDHPNKRSRVKTVTKDTKAIIWHDRRSRSRDRRACFGGLLVNRNPLGVAPQTTRRGPLHVLHLAGMAMGTTHDDGS